MRLTSCRVVKGLSLEITKRLYTLLCKKTNKFCCKDALGEIPTVTFRKPNVSTLPLPICGSRRQIDVDSKFQLARMTLNFDPICQLSTSYHLPFNAFWPKWDEQTVRRIELYTYCRPSYRGRAIHILNCASLIRNFSVTLDNNARLRGWHAVTRAREIFPPNLANLKFLQLPHSWPVAANWTDGQRHFVIRAP